ncbi:MAG: hypothetical protein HeimC3_53210 [Candidatus Heimdallarchaeota archaeon LC_3]|nr:MAG: hypothetical protein HeimC3_53210 [Candidatus Heimdallarchaeota archaeon LC_3]
MLGEVGGTHWENNCHKFLKLRYQSDNYVRVPARYKGDYGIESYTQKGIVFQFYCPDYELASELYEHQRDKITRDLGKLIKYQKELEEILIPPGYIIKEWHFVTPMFDNKEILKHIKKKILEIRKKCHLYPLIDNDFVISLKEESDYVEEISRLVNLGIEKYHFLSNSSNVIEIDEWMALSAENNMFYENTKRKQNEIENDPEKLKEKIHSTLKSYLLFEAIKSEVLKNFPPLFNKINKVHTNFENELVILNSKSFNEPSGIYLKNTYDRLKMNYRDVLSGLIPPEDIDLVCQGSLSQLISECPLDLSDK